MSLVFNMVGGGSGSAALPAIYATYPAGFVCTCSNGVDTYTAKDTTGFWLFAGLAIGSWTITATDPSGENEPESLPVEITSEGQVANIELSLGTNLFYNGNQYTGLTGGWSDSGWSIDVNGGTSGTVSIGETIDISTPAGTVWHGKALGTNSKIDLSNFTTLIVVVDELQITGSASFKISVTSNKVTESNSALAVMTMQEGVNELDVSAINTDAYIALNTRTVDTPISGSVSLVRLR